MQNADFRLTFADRLYTHLHHDGALTDANAQARWHALADLVEPAIVAESARWGDVRYEDPVTVDDWRHGPRQRARADGRATPHKLLALARDAGYYPSIDPPLFSQQGGEFDGRSVARNELWQQPAGERRNLLHSRRLRPAPASHRRTGRHPVHRTRTAYRQPPPSKHAPSSTASGAHSTKPTSSRPGQRSDVRITEIMYHPVGDEEAEFLELANLGELTADLTGAYLEGVDYRFPDDARLGARRSASCSIRDLKKFRRTLSGSRDLRHLRRQALRPW